MIKKTILSVFFSTILLLGFSAFLAEQKPILLALDYRALQENKTAIANGNEEKKKVVLSFIRKADKIISEGKLYSVMHKKQTPPSGDKHDYMSTGPYWWPDPTKPDGLPYIRKDGEVNPTYHDITDTDELDDMAKDVEHLGIAYFYSNDEKYANFAAKIIKTWFLEVETKMNPNLNFGQSIPGINTGRGIGIIETRGFVNALDGVLLIQNSKSWSKTDHKNLQNWFTEYLYWLTKSQYGIDESNAENNHGTHYDAQIVGFALFTGNNELAKKQLEKTKERIEKQLKADGSQPHELARTASWNYCNMNLGGFFTIAQMAENVGVDLWSFETSNGKSIRKALDWFLPYAKKEKNWEFQQIKKIENDAIVRHLKIATVKYRNTDYETLVKNFDVKASTSEYLKVIYR